MRIFEQQEDRILTSQVLELIENRGDGTAALLPWAERQSWISSAGRNG